MSKIFVIILFLIFAMISMRLAFSGSTREIVLSDKQPEQSAETEIAPQQTTPVTEQPKQQQTETDKSFPLDDWTKRITKKPFGIYINPETSPVQPERFQGWHTGTDFEIFETELQKSVETKAVCSGAIIEKKFVGGYGGVIIQSCELENEPITVLYGHLDLKDNPIKKNDIVVQGQIIAELAADQSFYSAGERKHLHLGIHSGGEVELKGYTQTKNQLGSWLDFEQIHNKLN